MGESNITGGSTLVDLDVAVDVHYECDEPFEEMHNGKYYPITVKHVKFRGQDITHLLHISHIMQIQRRVYNRIMDHLLATNTIVTKQGEVEVGHG